MRDNKNPEITFILPNPNGLSAGEKFCIKNTSDSNMIVYKYDGEIFNKYYPGDVVTIMCVKDKNNNYYIES